MIAAAAPVSLPSVPHDREAEQSVLGALLLNAQAVDIVRDVLVPEDLHDERHQHILRAALALSDRGEPIDALTLRDQLERMGAPRGTRDIDYIAELAVTTPAAVSVGHYAEIVRGHAVRRRVIAAGTGIAELGRDLSLDAGDVCDRAEASLLAVTQERRVEGAARVADVVRLAWADMERALSTPGLINGVPTSFATLDRMTRGLQPGELVLLAARPSVGKTSMAIQIARNAALLAEVPTLVFSLEMSRESLVRRLLCSEAGVDSFALRSGTASTHDFQGVALAIDRFSRAPLWIDDTPSLSVQQLRSRARRACVQSGVGLVVVDYLQLMRGGRQDSRTQEVSDISAGLKSIARELSVPVLAVSQLSRESERRADRRPQLSDLRESGSLEQDADVVLLLYREGIHDRQVDASTTTLILAKNRNGPVGELGLRFRANQTTFAEVAAGCPST